MRVLLALLIAVAIPCLWIMPKPDLGPAEPQPVYLSIQVTLTEPDPDFDVDPGLLEAFGDATRISLHVTPGDWTVWQFQHWLPAGTDAESVLRRIESIPGVGSVDYF